MKRSRFLILMLVFAMILGTLAGCGKSKDSEKTGKDENKQVTEKEKASEKKPEEKKPEETSKKLLNVCIASEPTSIDPALNTTVDGAMLIQHAFEGLLKWVDDGSGNAKLAPGQAEKWETKTNPDGTVVWTFHLRDGIKWSDGKPVTSKDFLFAWNRLVDAKTAADYEYMLDMVKGYEDKKLDIQAPDDKTFVVTLTTACPYFEEICAFPATYPVREDVVGTKDWATKADTYIVNGPFKMTEWSHNEYITMEKNPEYYDSAAYASPGIKFFLKDDNNAIYAAYRSDELDFITGVPNDEKINLFKTGELKAKPQIGTYFVCFNNQKEPFNNPKVREAFTLAIDRNFIVENVTGTGQEPAGGYVPDSVNDAPGTNKNFREVGGNYYDVSKEAYEANCKKAKELLKEAGFPDGKGFPVVEYLYNKNDTHKAIGEALQNMWETVLGVKVTLQNQDWSVFVPERKAGNYSIARHGWIADYNDPMSFIDMWLTGGGNNDAKYSNPKFDELVKKAKIEADPAKRMELLHQAEDILVGQDYGIAPLYFYTNNYMMKDNIKGLYYSPLGFFFFGNTTGY